MSLVNLSPLTASDGENLALYEWHPDEDAGGELATCMTAPRGVVLIVHGLGEHAGRYHHVAQQLMAWGFLVRAYDQRGHGESGGARGSVPLEGTLIDDLADVVDFSRSRCRAFVAASAAKGVPLAMPPLILLGHSLGGLVVSRFAALELRPVEAVVLSSPALDPGLHWGQRLALRLALRFAPELRVPNGLKPQYLSHDTAVVSRYLADPLVHNKISARLAQFIATHGPLAIESAKRWATPTLLLFSGNDHLVNAAGSRRFAANAAAAPVAPGTVASHGFDALYHELFNEPEAEPVFGHLKNWLTTRF